ncbi:hypothetical protein V1460_23210 [Streptomyces sp. SCSIO 30461]|uniref:hypothetical protein n=1 Tax=Streptomyces sp. SCSIO 30461 TaxID=3118085 RepID=UPI0030D6260D
MSNRDGTVAALETPGGGATFLVRLPRRPESDGTSATAAPARWSGNGTETSIYRYGAALEFPYTVGCFRGTPVEAPEHDRTETTIGAGSARDRAAGTRDRQQGHGGRQRPGQTQGQNQGQGSQGHH